MLSIILYGRNDAHGYNLHKRAALSLNAIAAVLTEPTDEILFVDYNTPDELPTFPEAIADTLTAECKARLRVLRVRPGFHRQFAGKTRLFALESQSRNIAVRRANPANRWILSTNTDMIFCAEAPAASLSSVIGGLGDGFYHLPRFELPEGFWERLSRTDPQTAIAAMRENGRRFHLNEIVWGIDDNLFEAPGDFQLFLREDLFAIEGFEERMLVGWHVDSNIARRMRLFRGEVKNLFPRLSGYHCGHTRQATALHGGNRTQNDFEFFVTGIMDPVAHHQAGQWGAPDETIEEIRLDQPDLYFGAMAAAVPEAGPDHSDVTYNETSFGHVNVDADHALPHLCDLLFNFPPGQKIFFFGPDTRLLTGVRDFLEAAGREPEFLLADLAGSPDMTALDPARWAPCVRPLAQALDEADLLLLQYPSADAVPEDARLEAEWWSQRVFNMFAAKERARPVASRRRIVVLNAIHTGITNLVEATLAPTVTPFSSRLRQGFVIDDAAATAGQRSPLEGPIYARLGRAQLFTPQDRTLLDRVAASLQDGKPIKGWERLAPEIAAICTSPAPIPASFGFEPGEAEAWAAAADTAMRANIARAIEEPIPVGPRVGVGNRILSGADWDDADWSRLAVSYFSPESLSFRERKRWVWERASLAYAVQSQLPAPMPQSGDLGSGARILVLARHPEFLTAILTHMGYEVVYASINDFLEGKVSEDWRPSLDLTSMLLPRPLQPYVPGQAPAEGFDALVATLPSLFEAGGATADAVLQAADPLMAKGARLFASATVQMNEIAYEGGFSYAEWKALYASEGPLGMRGFEPIGGFDVRIPLDTVVRFAFEDDPQDSIPGLSYGFLKGFNSSALLCAKWPEVLRPGPTARIEYGEPQRPDPDSVRVPYGGGQARSLTDAAAVPAAQAAAFAAVRTLEAVGREALVQAPVLKLQPRAVTALPFITPLARIERQVTRVILSSPGGAGLVLPVDPDGATGLQVVLDLADGASIAEAVAVDPRGARLPLTVDGARVTVSAAEPLPALALVIRLSEPRATLDGILLSPL
jgi:hypothetical protein